MPVWRIHIIKLHSALHNKQYGISKLQSVNNDRSHFSYKDLCGRLSCYRTIGWSYPISSIYFTLSAFWSESWRIYQMAALNWCVALLVQVTFLSDIISFLIFLPLHHVNIPRLFLLPPSLRLFPGCTVQCWFGLAFSVAHVRMFSASVFQIFSASFSCVK